MEQAFQGFNEDTYKFLLELAFQNRAFFRANNPCKANVQAPMRAWRRICCPWPFPLTRG